MPLKKYHNPPYESPLEEKFARTIKPFLKKSVDLIPQYEIQTDWGMFRIDFMLKYRDQNIAIECDGETVHGKDAQLYDNWRDIICLSMKTVKCIYRISGNGLLAHINETISRFMTYEPQLFRQAILLKLENEVKSGKNHIVKSEQKDLNNFYLEIELDMENKKSEKNVQILKLKKQAGLNAEQRDILKFLKTNPGKRINPLIYKYYKQR